MNRRRHVTAFLLATAGAVVAPGRPLAAQRDSAAIPVPEIVVTATRRPTPAELVTSRVTVISGASLRARGITMLADALRDVPGLTVVQTGAPGSTASLFMRGGESDYVQVLIDGVAVNEPGGSFDAAHLTVANIERIEVLRGPASVLYGSDAVAGVVQVFTHAGGGASRMTGEFRAGSYGTIEANAGFQGGGDAVTYAFSGRRARTDGLYQLNNDYDNTSVTGNIHAAPDASTRVDLSVRYGDAAYHFPTDGGGLVVDANQFTTSEQTTIGLDVTRQFTRRIEGRITLSLNTLGTLFDDRQDDAADTVGFFAFRSQRALRTRAADAQLNLYVTPARVVSVGAEVEQEWERTDEDHTRLNRAYYTQGVFALADGLSVNAGARLDDNEKFGTFITYRAGVAYRLPTATRLHGSVGTGFKQPTFLEHFTSAFSTGNPDLEPERSRTWEAGIEQPLVGGRVRVLGTYFRQAFRELIQFTFSPPNPGDPNYFNVAAARASGIEVELRADPISDLTVSAQYSGLRTRVTDAGFDTGPDATFVRGDRLLRRPGSFWSAGASYRAVGRATLGAGLRYVGERVDRDFSAFPAERVVLPAYTTVELSADVDVARPRGRMPGVALNARVENLLDRRFQQVANFRSPRRTILVGGRVTL